MNRRKFLIAGGVVVIAAASIPLFRSKLKRTWRDNPLQSPDVLSHFCDEKLISQIGMAYREANPAENSKDKLTELLLTDPSGKKLDAASKSAVADSIEKKIQNEFNSYQTLLMDGWVVSPTEARQCALYTFAKAQS